MNKADLKSKWGKYCDIDSLVNDMMSVLKSNRHRCSEHGVCTVLDKYFAQKEPLIRMFATSNHYVGNMRIVVQRDFERDINKNAIMNFCCTFDKSIGARSVLLAYTDADGKKITDYMSTGCKKMDFSSSAKKIPSTSKNLTQFEFTTGATKKSYDTYQDFIWHLNKFYGIWTSSLIESFNEKGVDLKKGTKTSRAFNKMCVHYGVDKLPNYNKLFAQYADLVSVGVRKLYFVISLNPLDYLTMSKGINWTSCHRIDNGNGYGGMCAGGCSSYMLDTSSIITYVVENLDTPLHTQGKIYRQMYYYSDDLFIQSRLYPQGNDGATNLYDKFRIFMEEEFEEMLGVEDEDNWTHERGRISEFSENKGHHYPDAVYNSQCGIFYPTERKGKLLHHKKIKVGNTSYCFYCGKEQGSRNRLSHSDCNI